MAPRGVISRHLVPPPPYEPWLAPSEWKAPTKRQPLVVQWYRFLRSRRYARAYLCHSVREFSFVYFFYTPWKKKTPISHPPRPIFVHLESRSTRLVTASPFVPFLSLSLSLSLSISLYLSPSPSLSCSLPNRSLLPLFPRSVNVSSVFCLLPPPPLPPPPLILAPAISLASIRG